MSNTQHAKVLILNFVDERHADVYGAGSLFDAVLTGLGLTNAFSVVAARTRKLRKNPSGPAVVKEGPLTIKKS